MNCESFQTIAVDLARDEIMEAGERASALVEPRNACGDRRERHDPALEGRVADRVAANENDPCDHDRVDPQQRDDRLVPPLPGVRGEQPASRQQRSSERPCAREQTRRSHGRTFHGAILPSVVR